MTAKHNVLSLGLHNFTHDHNVLNCLRRCRWINLSVGDDGLGAPQFHGSKGEPRWHASLEHSHLCGTPAGSKLHLQDFWRGRMEQVSGHSSGYQTALGHQKQQRLVRPARPGITAARHTSHARVLHAGLWQNPGSSATGFPAVRTQTRSLTSACHRSSMHTWSVWPCTPCSPAGLAHHALHAAMQALMHHTVAMQKALGHAHALGACVQTSPAALVSLSRIQIA